VREAEAWLVVCRDHGWLHGSRAEARAEAYWLSKNNGLPIQEISNANS
jgi:hypothetical protein